MHIYCRIVISYILIIDYTHLHSMTYISYSFGYAFFEDTDGISLEYK